ncbi:MAG: peptidase MA family metallohydrolase [Chloroflexota bacterium]
MNRLCLLLALLFLTGASPGLAQSQQGISIVASTYENRFPGEAVFRLEAKSSAEIARVTLFYSFSNERGGSQAYAYPEFSPGQQIEAEYTLNTRKNYIPPGTEVTFFWRIEDAAGGKMDTSPSTFSYDDIRFQWRQLSEKGVSVYWYQGSEALAKGLLDAGLAAVKRLSAAAGIKYEHPMKIWVYASKSDMDPALPRRSDVYSQQVVTLGVRLSADVLAILGNHPEVKETLAHELSHMVIHQAAEGPYGSIPAWLDEGLAMNAEEKVAERYNRLLQDAVKRDALISLQSLSAPTGDPNQVDLFYAEARSVVKFLLDSYDHEKMRALLSAFKEGSHPDDALRKAYGFDSAELENLWRESLGLGPRPTPAARGTQPQAIPSLVPLGLPTPPPTNSQPAASLDILSIAMAGAALLIAAAAAATAVLLLRRG